MNFTSLDRLRAAPGALAVLALIATPLSAPSFAQSDAIEEIVVTSSRLRVESLQEAPVSVTVLQGDDLADLNLFNLKDISQIVPSLELNPGRSDTLFIRGIGSGGDTGFDQSVGIVIDDVPFSRGRWLSPAYFDVAQVEVLKGPQGVYLGKNATAGAVYLRSARSGHGTGVQLRARYRVRGRRALGRTGGLGSDNRQPRRASRGAGLENGWLVRAADG
jgi:iron complex outermembrane recepter protein